MTTNASIKNDWQQPNVGALVVLYELDTTDLGGSIYRFVEGTISGTAVVFQGQTFYPLDMESDGWELTGTGKLPRPTIKINSRDVSLRAALNTYDDMLGAQVRRKRTFSKYLDGEPLADALAEFPVDIYVIQRKAGQNKQYIEFELSAYMDFEGKKLPGRVVLKDTCTHTYRYIDPNTGSFVQGSCPWNLVTGDGDFTDYYDAYGVATTSGGDVCGRSLSDCQDRFGDYADLPTRAFPGVGRTR